MSTKKPSVQTLSRKQDTLARLKEHVKTLGVIARGKDGDFWKALKANLENVAKGAGQRIDSILVDDSSSAEVDFANAKYQAGCKFTAEQIILMVDRTDDYSAQALARIQDLEAELEELKQQQAEGVL